MSRSRSRRGRKGGGELGKWSSAGGKFWGIIIGASNQQFVWSAKLGKKLEGAEGTLCTPLTGGYKYADLLNI